MNITKYVGSYHFGEGSFSRLGEEIDCRRKQPGDYAVFMIDHFFRSNPDLLDLPIRDGDIVRWVDSTDEPTTQDIDRTLAALRKAGRHLPVALVGIGGGCALDNAKAVSNLLTNGGSAADYQGWDLVKVPGVFKIGVPTLSGTGAEASRTCVMMNEDKNLKLGMNSAHTVFDQLILDPQLTRTVPRDQYFYTGMDTYIHCVESLGGSFRHAVGDAFSRESISLCREVFLSGDMMSPANRERIMVASYLGGCAIGMSFVGVVHPLSAGLSMVLHVHHCEGNCIVMNVMDEFYPKSTAEFRRMMAAQGVSLRKGICAGLSDEQYDQLYAASIIHEKPLTNALGPNFREILTKERVIELFKRM